MEPSKVYFTDMRALPGTNLQQKLKRLILKAGIGQIDFQDKYAAIKIHFGEPGNLSYLRPNFAKTVADAVKELGGRPFLTDCNTLYVGRRKNALDHIEAAYENGFSPFSTGCQIIIADGLKGTDEVDVPVRGGEYIREAHIGRAVMDADIFISLSHFSRSFFADSSYMLSFSVLCSCVCSRLISPSVSSWHKQDNTLMHQSPGHIQRRTPYNF